MENNNSKKAIEKKDNIIENETNKNIENKTLSLTEANKVKVIDDGFTKRFFNKTKEDFSKISKSISKIIPFTKEYKKISKERRDTEIQKSAEDIVIDKAMDKTPFENELKDFDQQLRNIEQQLKFDNLNKSEKDLLENKFNNIESKKKKTLNQLDFISKQNAKYYKKVNNSNLLENKNNEPIVNEDNLIKRTPPPISKTPPPVSVTPPPVSKTPPPVYSTPISPAPVTPPPPVSVTPSPISVTPPPISVPPPLRYSKDYFEGAEHFEQGFEAKDKRNIFRKWFEQYRLDKDRKNTNKLYKKSERDLNNRFFKDLLGESNMTILRNTDKSKRRNKERELVEQIINNINQSRNDIENYQGILNENERENIFKRNGINRELYENYKRKTDQEEILRKLKIKEIAEDSIRGRIEESNSELDLNRKRKRFSAYVERDINYIKEKIEKLKLRNTYGDKDEIKKLRERLKELNKIEREKDNKIVKFTKELLKKRKDILKSPESKTKIENIKKEFFSNLKENGAVAVWEATQAVVIGPLKALSVGISKLSFGEFAYVLGAELAGHGGKSIRKTFEFLSGTSKSLLKGSKIAITGN